MRNPSSCPALQWAKTCERPSPAANVPKRNITETRYECKLAVALWGETQLRESITAGGELRAASFKGLREAE